MAKKKGLDIEELFHTFYTIECDRSKTRVYLDSLKKNEPSLAYLWVAILNDGRTIAHFDKDGEHLYREVMEAEAQDKLSTLGLIPVNPDLPCHFVDIPQDAKGVCFRRHRHTFMVRTGGTTSHIIIYVIGFEKMVDGKKKQWLRFIKSNGDFIDTNEFKPDWG